MPDFGHFFSGTTPERPGMELPALGASVGGEVFWHPHNCQVRVRLDEWRTSGD